ncbi:MAG: hypothetical protein V4503_13135 [Gemmatimonadota bacterium]
MIDLHGFVPCCRRELRRSRKLLAWVGGATVVALLLTPVLHGAMAIIPAALACFGAALLWFAPLGHLATDRVLGHLESDRALPVAFRVMAAGRLLGASLTTLPLMLAVTALMLSVRTAGASAVVSFGVVFAVPALLQLLAIVALWWVLAINSRWSLRRLWWIIPGFGLLPQLVLTLFPERLTDALQARILDLVNALVETAASPGGLAMLGVLAAALLFASFAGAAMLFASGIERYRFDPTQLGMPLARAPRRELRAMRRGPLLAVMRLRLRVATEQFRRELLVLAVGLVVAAVGPPALRDVARSYVPVLATVLPAGIAFQLFLGRATGSLIGMQQLPVSGRVVALGHLLAIALLALPGAIALQLLRELRGETFSLLALASSWAWLVTLAWLTAAIGLWFKPKYLVGMMLAVFIALAAGVMLMGDDSLGAIVRVVRTSPRLVGAGLPLLAMVVSAVLGVPLFAAALARYTPGTEPDQRLYQFQNRVGRS